MGETCVVVLITQRSEVQILPPLPVSAAQAPFPVGEGLWHAGRCSKSRSHARDLYGLTARQGDTRRDSVDTLDGSTPDRWVLGLEMPPVPTGPARAGLASYRTWAFAWCA